MHFIREACYRRPLEPKALVYGRGGTAIAMCLLFLSFCGYLINQIYNDQPLIQISSEQIGYQTETPDIEICAQGTTLIVVKCTAMYYNWTSYDIPNCWQRFFVAGANNETSKCYAFSTNKEYHMATGLTYDSRDALRRIDFYWNVTSIKNVTQASIAVPAITVQLFDPHFNPWKPETIGNSPIENKIITNIKLGATRATSFMNYSSGIFYYPQKYRAIKPGDVASVLGFKPSYIDIMTLENKQHDWPLQPNSVPFPPALESKLYHGYFSVQLAQSTIDIKEEIRQHTLLASVALAGGCYGVLTTIYILLFGMTRLTPWGLVHHIPVFISKRRHHNMADDGYNNENQIFTDQEDRRMSTTSENIKASNSNNNFSTALHVPWFFRSHENSDSKTGTTANEKEAIMAKMVARKLQDQSKLDELKRTDTSELHLLISGQNEKNSTTAASSPISFSNDIANVLDYDSKYTDVSRDKQKHSVTTLAGTLPNILKTAPNKSADNHEEVVAATDLNPTLFRQYHEVDGRTIELFNRVEELEIILGEYFINTAYLDQLRCRNTMSMHSKSIIDDKMYNNNG